VGGRAGPRGPFDLSCVATGWRSPDALSLSPWEVCVFCGGCFLCASRGCGRRQQKAVQQQATSNRGDPQTRALRHPCPRKRRPTPGQAGKESQQAQQASTEKPPERQPEASNARGQRKRRDSKQAAGARQTRPEGRSAASCPRLVLFSRRLLHQKRRRAGSGSGRPRLLTQKASFFAVPLALAALCTSERECQQPSVWVRACVSVRVSVCVRLRVL